MVYIILSILCSTLLVIILKLFNTYNVITLQAIVVNYFVCAIFGSLVGGLPNHTIEQIVSTDWFKVALILGFSFICLFNLMGWTAQKLGLATVSVANKLSLIIPVSLSFILFNEPVTALKITGILLAIIAILIYSYSTVSSHAAAIENNASNTSGTKTTNNWLFLILPLILFLGSGVNDTLVNLAQKKLLVPEDRNLFVVSIFSIAGTFGIFIVLYFYLAKKLKFESKSILWGIILGIPNYYSIYFLIEALALPNWQGATIFTVNNVGILITSALSGWIIFKEKLNLYSIIGLILATISIIIISL